MSNWWQKLHRAWLDLDVERVSSDRKLDRKIDERAQHKTPICIISPVYIGVRALTRLQNIGVIIYCFCAVDVIE